MQIHVGDGANVTVLMRTLAPLHSGDVQYRIVVLYTVGTIHTQGGGVLL